jgi:hypothetical protein
MSNIAAAPGSSGLGIPIKGATTPLIINLSVPLADTEVSQAIADGTKRISIKARGNGKLRLAYVSGETTTNYLTIWPGNEEVLDIITTNGLTLYFQSSKASETIEIHTWA